ncbi:MAG: hypothetical protein SGPRY_001060 [Prymnesium sp.]
MMSKSRSPLYSTVTVPAIVLYGMLAIILFLLSMLLRLQATCPINGGLAARPGAAESMLPSGHQTLGRVLATSATSWVDALQADSLAYRHSMLVSAAATTKMASKTNRILASRIVPMLTVSADRMDESLETSLRQYANATSSLEHSPSRMTTTDNSDDFSSRVEAVFMTPTSTEDPSMIEEPSTNEDWLPWPFSMYATAAATNSPEDIASQADAAFIKRTSVAGVSANATWLPWPFSMYKAEAEVQENGPRPAMKASRLRRVITTLSDPWAVGLQAKGDVYPWFVHLFSKISGTVTRLQSSMRGLVRLLATRLNLVSN